MFGINRCSATTVATLTGSLWSCVINHMVVQECCKDGDQSQRERAKFDPKSLPNSSTDHHQTLLT